MTKRLFIGINLNDTDQAFFLQTIKNSPFSKIQRVNPNQYHMTLVPPFYEDDVHKLQSLIHPVADRSCPFDVRFTKMCLGPDPNSPRLIWAKGEFSEALDNIRKALVEVLIPHVDLKQEEWAEFIPHITLARSKHIQVQGSSEWPIEYRVSINSFQLIESILSESVAEYRVLNTYDF